MSFYYPVDLMRGATAEEGRLTTVANQQALLQLTEKTRRGGYFPVGANTVWHGGLHLHAAVGAEVHACHRGRIVAARLAPDEAHGEGWFGSRNFILVKHREGARAWYSLYMHLALEPLEADSRRLARLRWLWAPAPLPGPAGGPAADRLVYDASGEVILGGDLSVKLGHFRVKEFSNDRTTVRVHRRLIDVCNALRATCGGLTPRVTDRSGHGVVLQANETTPEALFDAARATAGLGREPEYHTNGDTKCVYVSLRTREEDLRGTGAIDTTLLDALRAGAIVPMDRPVLGDDLLWWVGEYGSSVPGWSDQRTGLLHWEVFSAENLMARAPGWTERRDEGRDNFNLDQPDLVDQLESATRGEDDDWLSADEVHDFYLTDPDGAAAALRTTACLFCSEWGVDLDAAIADLPGAWYSKVLLGRRIRPYLWWREVLDEELPVDLPASPRVWHYNPIAFLPVDHSADVLRQAESRSGGGFDADYGSKERGVAGHGVPEDIVFKGTTILDAQKNGKNGQTYCTGLTFWTGFRVADAVGLLGDKSLDQMYAAQRTWYGNTSDADGVERQVSRAVPDLGVGFHVLPDDLKAGDLVQYWRHGGSGHSVVFRRWLFEERRRVGLEYRSSQSITRGIGDRIERFHDRFGRVLERRLYGARLTPLAHADRGPDAPEREDPAPAPQDATAPVSIDPPAAEPAPALEGGGVWHTIAEGEYLSLIALDYLGDAARWEEIYQHPLNADFRALRPDPDLVYPGDRVFVPTDGAAIA